ncbi:YitT family protein [Streptococcus sciuri]|uniref:YitT family protein n=1 Tax=Streptococcus sciuri TaxID=2973939 RepID=A0ABT2F678_9STRE|nr:YitT family protein [Streptococcus sciuri]MCS4487968.1 YitT family protein [Streptococcus sciuri]
MIKKFFDFFLVTIGALISAIGFNIMFLHNHIASGGVGGLAVSFEKLFDWTPATFVMASNIPLLILCFIFLGKDVFLKTIYGSLIYPIFIQITDKLPNITDNHLLAALFGGIIVGAGLGLVFLGNSSTGGTGIIVQILHKYTPLPFGIVLVLIDGIVVGIGFVAFDADAVMYSIIALFTISYVVEIISTGFNSSKNIMIITKETKKVRDYITNNLDRGVSQWPIIGGFTGGTKEMLMTTVSSFEFPRLQNEILKYDETAFIIAMPASQVMGRGFSLTKHYNKTTDDFLPPM